MKLDVNELSKEELRNLMKPLSIEILRIPVKENVKLEKKYITGFRVSSVTYIQLVPLYYQEIHSGNNYVERALLSSITDYLEEKKLIEQIKSLIENQQWNNCVKIGIILGNSICEIDFSIIAKIFSIEIPNEKSEAISLICEQICEEKINNNNTLENHEKEKHDLEIQIEKLGRDKISIDEKKRAAIKKRESVERELRDIENSLKQKQNIVEERNTTIIENELKIKKQAALISEQEVSLHEYKEKINEKDSKIKELNEKIVELEEKFTEFNEEKIAEYNDAIQKLVIDTIEDLKENYMLEVDQFDEIINSIDGDHSVIAIWNRLSSFNASIIEEVETAMRSNKVTADIIVRCDEIENNILVKYIILRAIKSLYFEYLSMNEKNGSISSNIFNKVDFI